MLKTERIEARIPLAVKKTIKHAADLEGCSLNEFITKSLIRHSQEIIESHERMTLTVEESIRVAKALLSSAKPIPKLRKAFKDHDKFVSMA